MGSDKVIDCMGGVVRSENTWIVEGDIEYSGYEESDEPKTGDGGKEQGDVFCTELLCQELL